MTNPEYLELQVYAGEAADNEFQCVSCKNCCTFDRMMFLHRQKPGGPFTCMCGECGQVLINSAARQLEVDYLIEDINRAFRS